MDTETGPELFQDEDHKTTYIFHPLGELGEDQQAEPRPAKRRKVTDKKKTSSTQALDVPQTSHFIRLFDGEESLECARLREKLYHETWANVDTRIQNVLREANRQTLNDVVSFVRDAPSETDKIPAGFITTGRNIASQDLLFEQLADSLRQATDAKFIRVRSAEAPNLKSLLRKIIKAGAAQATADEHDQESAVGQDGRRYLDYDLEALYAFVKTQKSQGVIVVLQDTEAFDGGLISELIALLRAWQDRIKFTILFGIATSVELFQGRLTKSTAQHLYGSQFDVAQADLVLEQVFKNAIADSQAALRVGPVLLRRLVERQQDEVAGIDAFVSSLKYAHMCHFYANPLSILLSEDEQLVRKLLQPQHIEAIRILGSFRSRVEAAVDADDAKQARSLLQDDEYFLNDVFNQLKVARSNLPRLRASLLLLSNIVPVDSFVETYLAILEDGIALKNSTLDIVASLRKLPPGEVSALCQTLADEIRTSDTGDKDAVQELRTISREIETLQARCKDNGMVLRNKHQGRSTVLRATMVDQRVQLSQESTSVTKEDKEFTDLVDLRLVKTLQSCIGLPRLQDEYLHEAFSYDSKVPYRDVFIPRPGVILERALSRPHDYLNCACCKDANGAVASTLPATSILYHLYCEAGALVNVPDLWSAFLGVVGDDTDDAERHALVQFYRALSELRIMGYVKQSKKKADHVAKVKWL